jgi:hypothetical protein
MNCQSTIFATTFNVNCGKQIEQERRWGTARKGRSGVENPAPALQPAFEKENRNGN